MQERRRAIGAAAIVAAGLVGFGQGSAIAAARGPELVSVSSAGSPLAGEVHAGQFQTSDDGNVVALRTDRQTSAGGNVRTVYARNRSTGTTTKLWSSTTSYPDDVAVSGNARYVAVAADGAIREYDLRTHTHRDVTTGGLFDLTLSDDGSTLAFSDGDHSLQVFDVASGKQTQTVEGSRLEHPVLSGDGSTLAWYQDGSGEAERGHVYVETLASGARHTVDLLPDGSVGASAAVNLYGISDNGRDAWRSRRPTPTSPIAPAVCSCAT